jgi:Flp pilus assembly protein TadD
MRVNGLVKRLAAICVTACLLAAGCQSNVKSTGGVEDMSSFADSADSVADLSDESFYPTDELVKKGKVQFNERNYGKAYAYFKKAVEVYPKDPQAWLGYAAAADHLGRFDNADRAYAKLEKMIPTRPEYLNNRGYSYLLRGDLPTARRYFVKAYEIDPSNETTANNIELMRNSTQFAERG